MKQEFRLKKWDELIRQGRYPGIQSFCQMTGAGVNISERTLESDIRALKKILAEKYTALDPAQLLKYSRSYRGYYYGDTISAFTEIDNRDYRNLQDLSRSLSGFAHLFVTNEAKNALYKLKAIAKLEESDNDRVAIWNPLIYTREGARDGQEFFDEIIHAIENLCPVTIQYRAFGNRSPRKHIVLPLVIKEWQNAWYLLAFPMSDPAVKNIHLKKDELQLFALNRIERLSREAGSMKDRILNLEDFNPAAYFHFSFGVFRENLASAQKPEILKLVLETADAWMYDYVKRTPIHHSLNIVKDDPDKNYLRFSMNLEWSPELEAFLLQFSPMLKLTGNAHAVRKFRERLARIQEAYRN